MISSADAGPFIITGESLVQAEFSADPTYGVTPLEVQFTDLSSGNITLWEWDFDNDGTIDSQEQNPVWTYEQPDIYSVWLHVSDGTNSDTIVKFDYILVGPAAIADFTADPTSGQIPLEVQFTSLSTGIVTYWEWDFQNDGVIDSYEQNPSYTYTESGIYSVSLTVSNEDLTDTEIKEDYIIVEEPLIADFEGNVTTGVAPLEVQFTDLSEDFTGVINSWLWDFDNDGIVDSYLQNPVYTYTETGVYTVSLTVSDGVNEDTEIKEDYITITETLNADFEGNVTTGVAPLEVQFTDLSEDFTGVINSWLWDFD
ncbi:MAG: PKD domain-containing protein, partial [Candidatus Cloacimonetes bacterium]|nr:PKD domain-containing protein [Candidatus Cloacimonadota bacterium]